MWLCASGYDGNVYRYQARLSHRCGKEASGVLKFADLDVGKAFAEVCPSNTHLLNLEQFEKLAPRRVNSQKGPLVDCIGGNAGMSGAIRLAGEAALRAGTGLVKIYAILTVEYKFQLEDQS